MEKIRLTEAHVIGVLFETNGLGDHLTALEN